MKFYLLFWLAPCLLMGCQALYRPNVVNTPLFHEKGGAQVSIHAATSGTNFQGAFSLKDNIAIFANGVLSRGQNYHSLIEGGGGYFNNLEGSFVIEMFGGFGLGKAGNSRKCIPTFQGSGCSSAINGKYQKIFLMPGAGFSRDFLDLSFTPRFTVVNFYDVTTNHGQESDMFLEPVLTARVGYKYIKVTSQVGLSLLLGSSQYDQQPFNFSLGLQLNIAKRFEEEN